MLYIFLKSFVTYCQWKHFAKTAPFLSNLFIYISLHIFISLTCYVTLFYFVSLEGGEGIVTANSRDCSANYPNTWGSTSPRSIYVYKRSNHNKLKIIALQIEHLKHAQNICYANYANTSGSTTVMNTINELDNWSWPSDLCRKINSCKES